MGLDVIRAATVSDVVAEHAHGLPRHTAAVCQGQRFTYTELDARVDRLAGALSARGVGRGDRVLWAGQNCHRVLETLLAVGRLGAMVCPINWRMSADEMRFVLEDFDPAVVLCTQDLLRSVGPATAGRGGAPLVLCHDAEGPGSYESFLASGVPDRARPDVAPGDPVLVIYTSAFGGRPNGSMLSHEGLLAAGWAHSLAIQADQTMVYLACGPMFHIGVWLWVVPTLMQGGTNVFTPRADPADLCPVIVAERCTDGYIMPVTALKIVEFNRDRRYDLSSLRSGVLIPEWQEMVRRDDSPWGRSIAHYGQTELSGSIVYSAAGTAPGVTTTGRPIPGVKVRFVDDTGREVAGGEIGEIVVRGPMVHRGYWNRPELNAARFRDGWWHTGDVGRREPDGRVSFLGPKSRMLKSGNENIYPAEVEACLRAHPAVAEAAVIGVPDPLWVQAVKAVVVLRPGESAGDADLVAHCRTRIASYKKPSSIVFVDALPRVGSQVDYAALDSRFGGGNYPGGATPTRAEHPPVEVRR